MDTKPSKIALELYRIAAGISNSRSPDPRLVEHDLRRVLAALPTTVQVTAYIYNGSVLVEAPDAAELQSLIDSSPGLDEGDFAPAIDDRDWEMYDVLSIDGFREYLKKNTAI
jgi:hypothetical protein